MTNELKPGLYPGLPMADYLALPYASSSLLHTVLAYSPEHARYTQEHPDADAASETADIGTAIHDALLEGVDRIAVIDPADYRGERGGIPKGWTTNAIKAARDAARAKGLIPLFPVTASSVRNAVASALRCVEASELSGIFTRGRPEQTIVWDDSGLMCKCRPDWLTDDQDVSLHIKTTPGSAKAESWIRRQLEPQGYDVALAFYERGIYSLPGGGRPAPESYFLVIEQEPPHGCVLVGLDPAMRALADSKMVRALNLWRRCVLSGRYPGYPRQIHYAEPKPWQLAEEELRNADDAYDELQLREGMQA